MGKSAYLSNRAKEDCVMQNRQQRRQAERERARQDEIKKKEAALQFDRDMKASGSFDSIRALGNPHYMAKVVELRKKQRALWEKNGITKDDLEKEYDRGYKAAQSDLATEYAKNFFAAACITLHRDFGFGKNRLWRMMQTMYNIIAFEMTADDVVERCRRETGVDINVVELEDACEVDVGDEQNEN